MRGAIYFNLDVITFLKRQPVLKGKMFRSLGISLEAGFPYNKVPYL